MMGYLSLVSVNFTLNTIVFISNTILSEESHIHSYFTLSTFGAWTLDNISISDSIVTERVMLFNISNSILEIDNFIIQNTSFTARDLPLITCKFISTCNFSNWSLHQVLLNDTRIISSEDGRFSLSNLTITNSTFYSPQFIVAQRNTFVEINIINLTQNYITRSNLLSQFGVLLYIQSTVTLKIRDLYFKSHDFEISAFNFIAIQSSITELLNIHFEGNSIACESIFKVLSSPNYLMDTLTLLNNTFSTEENQEGIKIISIDKSQGSIKYVNSTGNVMRA